MARTAWLGGLALAAVAAASAAIAQPSFHKTTLQEQDFPGQAWRTVTVRTVVDPGGEVAPHTHPGAEMGYVLSGRGELDVQGAPPRRLAAGDSFSIREGQVHAVRDTARGPLTLLSTYVVDKAKPIATPAR